jgi:hypothetical protein
MLAPKKIANFKPTQQKISFTSFSAFTNKSRTTVGIRNFYSSPLVFEEKKGFLGTISGLWKKKPAEVKIS